MFKCYPVTLETVFCGLSMQTTETKFVLLLNTRNTFVCLL